MFVGDIRRSPMYALSSHLGDSQCSVVAKLQKAYRTGHKDKTCTLTSAMTFYTLNALVGKILVKFTEHQTLPAVLREVVGRYESFVELIGPRVFWYMTAISQQEMRHIYPAGLAAALSWAKDKTMGAWMSTHMTYERFEDKPPNGTFSTFMTAIEAGFMNKEYWGGAFGGPPWSAIQKNANDFAKGLISLEAMIDTAWTLAHNTAPMFNKGYLFTIPNTTQLHAILDLQRAGQIVEYIRGGVDSCDVKEAVPNDLWNLVEDVTKLYPNWFGTEVDWQQVMGSNPVGQSVKNAAGVKKLKKGTPEADANVQWLDHQTKFVILGEA